jgi:methylated-DNA-[protein]-cysteine S-methyltransferase
MKGINMIRKIKKPLELNLNKSLAYGYYNSPIGILEIKAFEDAITSVIFVEEATMVTEESKIIKDAITQLDEYFKGIRKVFDLKCEMRGTDFQKKVWDELIKIPCGDTLSYKELAIIIGNEKAPRAVGNANGKNPISIIVPCHRVIGSNKSLTGYAGGINRKQWLLSHENNI